MTHRHMAEVLTQKLTDEELDSLVDILTDRHQLLLHALGTYKPKHPAVGRTPTPRKIKTPHH